MGATRDSEVDFGPFLVKKWPLFGQILGQFLAVSRPLFGKKEHFWPNLGQNWPLFGQKPRLWCLLVFHLLKKVKNHQSLGETGFLGIFPNFWPKTPNFKI